MKNICRRILTVIAVCLFVTLPANASLNLDSIAQWGKFPRFVVNTYRWGDKFFNSYDSTYVTSTGKKFNAKFRTETVIDYYNFSFSDKDIRLRMTSDPSTSVGLWLTYLAVSVGYDYNISNRFGWDTPERNRLTFAFNCSLFSVDLFYENNKGSAHIDRFGEFGSGINPDIKFNSIDINSWGIETYYFFNHKKYSQAAAFSFGRVQQKSQGSFFAGISFYSNDYKFDFSSLPDDIKDVMPEEWENHRYYAQNINYALKIGYGYNWVLNRHWLIGVSEAPTFGIRKGILNNSDKKLSFGLANKFKLSAVWNNKKWFMGLVGDMNLNLIYDKKHTFINSVFTTSFSVGYRFNIW